MIGLLYILLAIAVTIIVFLLFQAVGGKLVGARIEEIGFFTSPRIFTFQVRGIKFSLNLIPLGGFVKFTKDFEGAPPLRKILLVIAGLLSYVVIAVIALGVTETVQQTLNGFGQYLWGAISPVSYGAKLIEATAKVFTEKGFLNGLGIVATKFLAGNLLPFGSLAGGQLIIHILELGGFTSEKFRERYVLISLLPLLLLFIGWAIAFSTFVWRLFGA